MFGLFKTKGKSPELEYHVYKSQIALYRQLINELIKGSNSKGKILLIYHFDATGDALEKLLNSAQISFTKLRSLGSTDSKITLASAKEFKKYSVLKNYSSILFSEIHPMAGVDVDYYQSIESQNNLAEVVFYASMDNLILAQFGAERIIGLMVKMGMEENEKIEHKMITKSIFKAQEKIKKSIVHEKEAESVLEWMELNIHGMRSN